VPFLRALSRRLAGLYRHTDEDAGLWRDVLAAAHRVVGECVGKAPCYYATEPLDNPDYELFLEDYLAEFGRVPQTTTAVALRNIERTRHLLQWGQAVREHFDRISVLSRADFDAIISAFTPEELIFTDLLSQFREAPISTFIQAGRNRDDSQGIGSTIACVSGFVVNMFERSVRLVTPVAASDEHPTGEQIFDTATFTDGVSFEDVLREMIERHMQTTIGLADLFATAR